MSIHLDTFGLNLDIELSLKPSTDLSVPYEDWITSTIKVMVPGFTGNLPIDLEFSDFERFLDELRQMNRSIGERCQATLDGVEQDFILEIKSDKFGHILGRYEIAYLWNAFESRLSGDFEMDQSYLQPLIMEIDENLKKLSETQRRQTDH